MSHASYIRNVDIDVVYIIDNELRRLCDFQTVRFNDEKSFSSEARIKTAELNNNQLAGYTSFNVKLKEILHVWWASDELYLISDLCRSEIAEHSNQFHSCWIPYLEQRLIGGFLIKQMFNASAEVMEK